MAIWAVGLGPRPDFVLRLDTLIFDVIPVLWEATTWLALRRGIAEIDLRVEMLSWRERLAWRRTRDLLSFSEGDIDLTELEGRMRETMRLADLSRRFMSIRALEHNAYSAQPRLPLDRSWGDLEFLGGRWFIRDSTIGWFRVYLGTSHGARSFKQRWQRLEMTPGYLFRGAPVRYGSDRIWARSMDAVDLLADPVA